MLAIAIILGEVSKNNIPHKFILLQYIRNSAIKQTMLGSRQSLE